jgi:hypothetical protein
MMLFVATSAGRGQAGKLELRPEEWRERLAHVHADLAANDVLKRLGKPDRTARQILFKRHLEQWVYEEQNVRIELNCLPGAEPRVLNVLHGIPPSRP